MAELTELEAQIETAFIGLRAMFSTMSAALAAIQANLAMMQSLEELMRYRLEEIKQMIGTRVRLEMSDDLSEDAV